MWSTYESFFSRSKYDSEVDDDDDDDDEDDDESDDDEWWSIIYDHWLVITD